MARPTVESWIANLPKSVSAGTRTRLRDELGLARAYGRELATQQQRTTRAIQLLGKVEQLLQDERRIKDLLAEVRAVLTPLARTKHETQRRDGAWNGYGLRTTENYVTAIWHGCGDLPLE